MHESLIKLADWLYAHNHTQYIDVLKLATQDEPQKFDAVNVYDKAQAWTPPADWQSYIQNTPGGQTIAYTWAHSTPPNYDRSYKSFLGWYQKQRVLEAYNKGLINPDTLPHISPTRARLLMLVRN